MKYHEDGLKRNLLKLRDHARMTGQAFWWHMGDWVKQPWNVHHYVDVYVETLRASPYFWGHVFAVYVPLRILWEIL